MITEVMSCGASFQVNDSLSRFDVEKDALAEWRERHDKDCQFCYPIELVPEEDDNV